MIQIINPIIVAALFVLGIFGGDPIPIVLAIAMGLFIWFTRHSKYDIFSDRMIIHYGKPRQKIVPLNEIEQAHLVLGGRGLFLKRKGSGGLLIRPRDPEAFKAHLDDALGGIFRTY